MNALPNASGNPSPPSGLVINVPAKINLFLHVTGRRADGYHLLESIFCPVDCCDRLTLRMTDTPGVVRSGGLPGLDADNDLTVRAARLLLQSYGAAHGLEIELDKKIPAGAGMGGGSADAAFTLLGLNRLLGSPFAARELVPMALQLGADVPFFLDAKPAFVSGIGEEIEPIDVDPLSLVIVKPPVSVATAAIFGSPHLTRSASSVKISVFGFSGVSNTAETLAAFIAEQTTNQLQPVAQQVATEIEKAVNLLQSLPAACKPEWVRMTGSGSAVFGVFADRKTADQAALHLQQVLCDFKSAHNQHNQLNQSEDWFVWSGSTLQSATLENQIVRWLFSD